jgi:hypothetical protein
MTLVGEPPETVTQNADVTQDTAPVTEPAAGVVAVLAMVLQVDALTVAGEERAAPASDPPPSAMGSAVRTRAQPRTPKRSSERIAPPLVGLNCDPDEM